ncbi:MAG: DUF559 domain-containing protein [Candidatus Lokiarchaeota archaeon]|nr:DUF559 domain-containing protein [Candidatus Lokiarchaeota archaeon]MBD3342397.1 DUF559 domain-containing protein [Candidatus Lokiarchaeota archaeon]
MENRDPDDLLDYRMTELNKRKKAEREASSFYIVTSNETGKTHRFNSPRSIPFEYRVNKDKFEILKIRYEDMRDNDKVNTLFHPVIVKKVGTSYLEKILRSELIKLGYQEEEDFKFNARIRAGLREYHLDFAFPNQKVNIECDGEIWHEKCRLPDERQERDAFLNKNGWEVLRFDAKSIKNDLNNVVKTIQEKLEK